jgi:hypothetical protein
MNNENKNDLKTKNDPTKQPQNLDDLLEILDADALRHTVGGRAVRHVTVRR